MSANNEQIEIIVPEGISKKRADVIIANALEDFSRVQLQEVFDAGKVFLGDQAINKNRKVSAGDVIRLNLPEVKEVKVCAVAGDIETLYEDDDIVVINKAAGVVTHPGSGTGNDTLVHYLLHHTGGKLTTMAGALRPGVVHRLDKETTGVMIFAKSDKAYPALTKAFSEREVGKEYTALVDGFPELDAGTILEPIGRHPHARHKMQAQPNGRDAHTDWQVLKRFKEAKAAQLACEIYTGRTHQIRVHLSWMGHAILGDNTYGYKQGRHNLDTRLRVMLHARRLSIAHPISGKPMEFTAPLPKDFMDTMAILERA